MGRRAGEGDGEWTLSKIPNDPGYRAGWCIHYRYNRGEKTPEENTCEAGVRYDTIDRIMAKSPCFIKPGETAADRSPCAKLRPPTTEGNSRTRGMVS